MTDDLIMYRLNELKELTARTGDMLVKHTLQDNENFMRLHDELANVRLDVQTLKVKASMWGAVTGTLAGGFASAIATYVFNHLFSR